MRKYEIMYILKADLDEAGRKAELDKVLGLLTKNGAKIESIDETTFGLRELAYEINDETKGFYVVAKVEAEPAALYEHNRKIRHNANVLRHLVVNEDK